GGKDSQTYHDLWSMQEELAQGAPMRTCDTHPDHYFQQKIIKEQDKDLNQFLKETLQHEKHLGLVKQDPVYSNNMRQAASTLFINPRFKRPNSIVAQHFEKGEITNNEFGISVLVKNHDYALVSGEKVVRKEHDNIYNEHDEKATYPVLELMGATELRTVTHKQQQKQEASQALSNADRAIFEQRIQVEEKRQVAAQENIRVFQEFKASSPELTAVFNPNAFVPMLPVIAKETLNATVKKRS
ncbi:MAG: hypothetical protein JWM96_10, partial [Alphaproteobacteria bacterium]|nr:hypothetical protein [Alphaproteobacteria bacterium]